MSQNNECTCPHRYVTTQTPLGPDMHTPNCAVSRELIYTNSQGQFIVFVETENGQVAPMGRYTRDDAAALIRLINSGGGKPGDKIIPVPDDWPLEARPV
jgi:hypothetical protein